MVLLFRKRKFTLFADVDGTVIRCSHLPSFDERNPEKWRKACEGDPGSVIRFRAFCVRLLQRLGIRIVFLTARPDSMREFTQRQLSMSLGNDDFTLIMRPHTNVQPSSALKSTARRVIHSFRFTPIATVGDQSSDFEGGYTGLKIKLKTL